MSTHAIDFPGFADRLIQAIDRAVLKPLANWRARRIALDELSALDDHMLADIGIGRSEIPGIVAGEFVPGRAVNENRSSRVA